MTPAQTFGQRETAWKDWLINNVVGSTIGKYGCTTTVYGIALGYYTGIVMNPKATEIFLEGKKAYLGDLIDWRNTPYFRFRFYGHPVEDIKAEIRAGKMVLLNVDLVANDKKPDHWVLLLDESFTIFDPWYNETVPITKRYGKPETAIYGGAYFNWPSPPTSNQQEDMGQIQELQNAIKAKDAEIDGLKNAVVIKDNQLTEKDALIEAVKKAIDSIKNQYIEVSAELAEAKTDLDLQVQQHEEEVKKLRVELEKARAGIFPVQEPKGVLESFIQFIKSFWR